MDNGGLIMLIGKRIKEARKSMGYSQQELGDLLDVTKVSICGYEKGTRTPTLDTFMRLVDILKMDPIYALGLEKAVVAEEDAKYVVRMAEEDIQIINEFKKHRKLYNQLCNNPKRTIDIIDLNMDKK